MPRRNSNSKTLPSGHVARRCDYCSMWVVYLIYPNENKRRVPVHQEGLIEGDTYYDKERHVLHFAKCPNQKQRAEARKALQYCIAPNCQEKVAKETVLCGRHVELARPGLLKEYRKSVGVLSEDPEELRELLRQAVVLDVNLEQSRRLEVYRVRQQKLQDAQRR